MQAIIFCGIQGSGKSTFYKQQFFDTHIRISMDLLRTRNREAQLLDLCLRTSARFVVDNTNPTVMERKRYIQAALAAHYEVIGYYFHADIEDALDRNSQRRGRKLIPERGIRATRNKLQVPRYDEGFNHHFIVSPTPDFQFIVKEIASPQE